MMNALAPSDAGDQLVALWLHGRGCHTQAAYRADVAQFRAFVEKPLELVTLADLQAFADSLAELAPASRARRLSAVQSRLAFDHRLGLLPVNAGAPLRLPTKKDTLAERISAKATLTT